MRLFISAVPVFLVALLIGCGADGGTSGGGASGTTGGSGGSGATGGQGGAGGTGGVTGSGGSGAQAGSGGQGGSGGNEAAAACNACTVDKKVFEEGTGCGQAYMACQQDAACADWLDCTQLCYKKDFTPGCFTNCNAASSPSESLFAPVRNCTCDACAIECAPTCN